MDIASLLAMSLSFLVVLYVVWKVGSPLVSEVSEKSREALSQKPSRRSTAEDDAELREDYLSGKIDSEEFKRYSQTS